MNLFEDFSKGMPSEARAKASKLKSDLGRT